MSKQIEIESQATTLPKYQSDFLAWLNRFAHIPRVFRITVYKYKFSEEELDKLRPQITAKFRVKVDFLRRKGGA